MIFKFIQIGSSIMLVSERGKVKFKECAEMVRFVNAMSGATISNIHDVPEYYRNQIK